MDEKETIQKTINFIASEIRENKIQLKKLKVKTLVKKLKEFLFSSFKTPQKPCFLELEHNILSPAID